VIEVTQGAPAVGDAVGTPAVGDAVGAPAVGDADGEPEEEDVADADADGDGDGDAGVGESDVGGVRRPVVMGLRKAPPLIQSAQPSCQ
jgi:hypothetical protein